MGLVLALVKKSEDNFVAKPELA
ncbi:uncharacterized protein G2W53_041768 [Senna tora]|uniref:Uncharacterized protein n=1 Tax=Senna tora TaxID=362788 RepID=A0A834VYX3_9FABA|nr:uncharacterized protein G2W53_041565 [Senna tora]KAF7802458.1 uncharacterized protein G2W53_041569 [Senna tora]KAF7802469.1 uncharacterized protein G2W53_041580 [Senna tora]KAF7802470.1 uncharacterized protein G2W53_041581 [Senna tora]KAF7802472.1 uncharacterized protein G2W53_041583 [Senna tora]